MGTRGLNKHGKDHRALMGYPYYAVTFGQFQKNNAQIILWPPDVAKVANLRAGVVPTKELRTSK